MAKILHKEMCANTHPDSNTGHKKGDSKLYEQIP